MIWPACISERVNRKKCDSGQTFALIDGEVFPGGLVHFELGVEPGAAGGHDTAVGVKVTTLDGQGQVGKPAGMKMKYPLPCKCLRFHELYFCHEFLGNNNFLFKIYFRLNLITHTN